MIFAVLITAAWFISGIAALWLAHCLPKQDGYEPHSEWMAIAGPVARVLAIFTFWGEVTWLLFASLWLGWLFFGPVPSIDISVQSPKQPSAYSLAVVCRLSSSPSADNTAILQQCIADAHEPDAALYFPTGYYLVGVSGKTSNSHPHAKEPRP